MTSTLENLKPPVRHEFSFALSNEQLESTARVYGISGPGILLMTALAALLRRYSAQDQIVLETVPRAGRRSSTAFAVSLSVVTDVSFLQLANQIAALLSSERPGRDGDLHYPNIENQRFVIPAHLHRQLASACLGNSVPAEAFRDVTRQLTLRFEQNNGMLEYDPGLLDESIARQIGLHLTNLLNEGCRSPHARLAELQMLNEVEWRPLITDWNDDERSHIQGTIHEIFEARVGVSPDAIAILYEQQTISYDELNRRANRLAHYLVKRGVVPEICVGVCVGDAFETIVALLAVLKAGGCCLPLNPHQPQSRLEQLVQAASVAIVVTDDRSCSRFEGTNSAINLDRLSVEVAAESDKNLNICVSPENASFVIYTSGSTGEPKGVVRRHACLLPGGQEKPEQEIRCLNRSLHIGAAIPAALQPLLQGMQLLIIPEGQLRSIERLVRALKDGAVTRVAFVPSQLQEIVSSGSNLAARLPALKAVAVGGESLSLELVRSFADTFPGVPLINGYTTTEIGSGATRSMMSTPRSVEMVTIGRPTASVRIYILDRDLNPVPVGVPGEIYVQSSTLARGYLNQPGLTAERFLPNPFSGIVGDRLYRTGDTARYLKTGEIEIIGRIDDETKIRGFRVQPLEVERTLRAHPDVLEAVVVNCPGRNGNRLIAYVVSRSGKCDIQELREYLDRYLPVYMLPHGFVAVDRLPKLQNGKVDRYSLPAPGLERPELNTPYRKAGNATEERLASIWREVLELDAIGVDDDFFALGGDSLALVRMFAEIKEEFDLEIDIAPLDACTVAVLASQIELSK